MKFENTRVFNFEGAIRGMRNPLASHALSDSYYEDVSFTMFPPEGVPCYWDGENDVRYFLGEGDLLLCQKLIRAGSEHRKFLRQIFVSVDITAPAYFMAEFDTYKVGVVRNSSSFMHKGASKRFEIEDFEQSAEFEDGFLSQRSRCWETVLATLNALRDAYIETKDNRYFAEMRRLLPQSYLYRSTVSMNYENVLSMVRQRRNHRLVEWNTHFIKWARSLPYSEEFFFLEEKK